MQILPRLTGADYINAGDELKYVFTVQNHGDFTAKNILLEDIFPQHLIPVNNQIFINGVGNSNYHFSHNIEVLPPDSIATIELLFTVSSALPDTLIEIVNTAVLSAQNDMELENNASRHLDSKIHHNNLLNNILAKIQANNAGADAAVMLDTNGFVAELNDTNLFMAHRGQLLTPHANACLHGITRGLVIDLARETGISVIEKDLSLTEFYNADEVFATGTMGELTPEQV